MSTILGTVDHIRDINLRTFTGANNFKKLKNEVGTVKINSNTFSVRVLENNQLDVSFSSGNKFMNLFRWKTLTRARQQLQAAYDEAIQQMKLLTPKEQLQTLVEAGKAEIAHYGFNDVRNPFLDEANKENPQNANKNVTINDYNSQVGIDGTSLSLDVIDKLVDKVKHGTLEIKPKGQYTKDKLERWAKFLQDNVNKLDLFARIANDIAESKVEGGKTTGWAGEFRKKGVRNGLRELVMKNFVKREGNLTHRSGNSETIKLTNLPARVDLFVDILLKMVSMKTEGMTPEEIGKARGKILKDNVYGNKSCVMATLSTEENRMLESSFRTMIRSMFFRQTSKLGLQFFQKENIPVVTQWRNFEGKDISPKEFNDKWWKNENVDINSHRADPITFSEMRTIERMQKKGEGAEIYRVRAPGEVTTNQPA